MSEREVTEPTVPARLLVVLHEDDAGRDGHGAVRSAGLHAPDLAVRYTQLEPELAALAEAHATAIAALVADRTRTSPG